MRRSDLLRLLGVASLAVAASISLSATAATAFSGLSDKQKAHIEEYFHCKKLLWTDIPAFNADPVCGGSGQYELKSLAPTGDGVRPPPREPDCEWEYPEFGRQSSECPIPS
ncbi:hypothetical protein PRN20_10970 [Devosia sp. ZB163]|uniref:hypothetical protein n=1 Tax=Devosia sp. ZB163 TaxID=3025938 RepID=UPI0023613F5D|nr:hypothetical protein [Devosia sp. ZB163]MDC9824259.1 hypothetical protein [Devosia sp. ZB163]